MTSLKPEIYLKLAKEAGYAAPELAKRANVLADLVYNDIMRVVAAQALLNESALDVFKNLSNIFEAKQ